MITHGHTPTPTSPIHGHAPVRLRTNAIYLITSPPMSHASLLDPHPSAGTSALPPVIGNTCRTNYHSFPACSKTGALRCVAPRGGVWMASTIRVPPPQAKNKLSLALFLY
ncbi:uncharacterized protein H6S33_009979 [Morchella sextelata]|uniref:uncharacterized protein n=1 Tax=Morchella sextelata TaxID=1174677 RepID=UPI001D042A17|nr:uncharacterized protein H6S33_009979 [Morchella sextelata]KAH0611927.1 hypothetical protein H6S33_009979 [Morchella sextelata]